MFNKKELQEIEEKLNSLDSKLESNQKVIAAINEINSKNFGEIKNSINEINSKQSKYLEEFEKNLVNLSSLNQNYRKEFDNLASIKNQAIDRILEKIEKELKLEIQKHLDKLSLEQERFTALSNDLNSLKQEIQKLKAVSESIKTIDFGLNSYIQKITEQDKEKIRLLKQVDDLQSLIGKIRQGRHH